MPPSIRVSFQMYAKPTPLSMMPLIMTRNHRAGTIKLIHCRGAGMLEMGNMKPERIIVGSSKPARDAMVAVCCDALFVEIKIPSESAQTINSTLSSKRSVMLPRMGTSKISHASINTVITLTNERNRYGKTFPIMI